MPSKTKNIFVSSGKAAFGVGKCGLAVSRRNWRSPTIRVDQNVPHGKAIFAHKPRTGWEHVDLYVITRCEPFQKRDASFVVGGSGGEQRHEIAKAVEQPPTVAYFAPRHLKPTFSTVLSRKDVTDERRAICVATPKELGLPPLNDVAIPNVIGVAISAIRFIHFGISVSSKARRLHAKVKCRDSVSRLTCDDAA